MEAGELLGEKYRLMARLGRGGMGEVWAAYDEQLRRDIAVKIVLAELGGDPRLRASLQQEARTVAALQHANITVVHDVGEKDGHPYFVMEHLDGRTFGQLLEEHPQGLPVERAVGLMLTVADALGYAHRRGVVHRDIKPANLMFLAGGSVKILDFGIASYAEATAHFSSTGVVMGSPPFMPPEVWLGQKATPAADMYAFGATLYALLTGDYPFPGPTAAAWMRQHLDVEPPRWEGAADHVGDLIHRLLAKDPDERPSAAHSQQILEQVQGRLGKREAPLSVETPTVADTKVAVLHGIAIAATAPTALDRQELDRQETVFSGPARRIEPLPLFGGIVAIVVSSPMAFLPLAGYGTGGIVARLFVTGIGLFGVVMGIGGFSLAS
ncbi:serine/threonine-protein kinase [Catenulispora yoronensis]